MQEKTQKLKKCGEFFDKARIMYGKSVYKEKSNKQGRCKVFTGDYKTTLTRRTGDKASLAYSSPKWHLQLGDRVVLAPIFPIEQH